MTDVARPALAQPTAAADDAVVANDEAAADDDGTLPAAAPPPPPPAAVEAVTEPQPASAEHSSTASTVPRTRPEDIMVVGRAPRVISSIAGRARGYATTGVTRG
ncbi:MAG: hypothetical protein ACRDNT_30435 [Streptosporangiaceae bacterium]